MYLECVIFSVFLLLIIFCFNLAYAFPPEVYSQFKQHEQKLRKKINKLTSSKSDPLFNNSAANNASALPVDDFEGFYQFYPIFVYDYITSTLIPFIFIEFSFVHVKNLLYFKQKLVH